MKSDKSVVPATRSVAEKIAWHNREATLTTNPDTANWHWAQARLLAEDSAALPSPQPRAVANENTSKRADRLAERLWREFADDSKLNIKRIRAIAYIYLTYEREAAIRKGETS